MPFSGTLIHIPELCWCFCCDSDPPAWCFLNHKCILRLFKSVVFFLNCPLWHLQIKRICAKILSLQWIIIYSFLSKIVSVKLYQILPLLRHYTSVEIHRRTTPPLALQSKADQGFFMFEASWSHSRHTTFSRTHPDKRSVRCGDLYLQLHGIHRREASMAPVGFEPAVPISERPKTHVLDHAATGIV
jgi:hypothetical protein